MNEIVPLINGVAYSWADIKVVINGIQIMGITAIEYSDKQEIANHYGAGRYPVSRGKGRITCEAKISIEMKEVLAAQGSNSRLQDIAPFDVQVSYLPEGGKVVHDVIRNCQFTENSRKWKEGDTNQVVELPLMPSHIDWGR